MTELLRSLLVGVGLSTTLLDNNIWIEWLVRLSMLIAAVLLAWLFGYLLVSKVIAGIVRRSKNKIDDRIYSSGVLHRLGRVVPAVLFYWLLPQLFTEPMWLIAAARRVAVVYVIFQLVLITTTVLDVLHSLYEQRGLARIRPIKAYVQVAKIAALIVGGVLAITTLLDRSPLALLGGVGAISAVLILIFKDTLLGLVASAQLNANDMVHIGDWIEMPKHNADGDVVDVGLQTVRVQNWDKTIVSIPTYALVSESFVNWRGMTESGGRRIKRAIYIDANSVRFCDAEQLERYEQYALIGDYVRRRLREVREHNRDLGFAEDDMRNGRRLTNLGTFRAYVNAYLHNHPQINHQLTCMVRQLQSGEHGIPLELYAFCADQKWENYEAVQADILDHLLAVVNDFDLRVYQLLSDGAYMMSK